jgi:hypothetical protein
MVRRLAVRRELSREKENAQKKADRIFFRRHSIMLSPAEIRAAL